MAAATGQVAGGLTAYDRRVLTAVNAGAASLSFVGSGFIVLCYVLFKELRKFSFKLVFYLALSVSLFLSPSGLLKLRVFLDLIARSLVLWCGLFLETLRCYTSGNLELAERFEIEAFNYLKLLQGNALVTCA